VKAHKAKIKLPIIREAGFEILHSVRAPISSIMVSGNVTQVKQNTSGADGIQQ